MRTIRTIVLVAGILAAAGCGRVSSKADAGPGTDTGSGGGSACVSNDECAAPTPYCDPGVECVACLESAHCPAEQPVCDSTSHECRACTLDAECDSTLCDVSSGKCIAEGEILFVAPNGPDAGTCPKGQPCSLAHANAIADQARYTLKLAPGSYTAQINMTGPKRLDIFGVGATISAQGTQNLFDVEDGARLRVVGATLIAMSGLSVIRCENATSATPVVELVRTTLDNTSTAVLGNPCMLTIEQSVLRSSSTTGYLLILVTPTVAKLNRARLVGGGGLTALDATVQITNSVFENVGNPASHGMFNGGTYDVSFSTLLDSIIECSSSGSTALTLNSSVVLNTTSGAPADSIQTPDACASITHSVVFPQSAALGFTNVRATPQLKNPAADDYHLLSTSPAIDRGDPASTNAVDFDGTSRPQGSGRDSGAFEYKP